MPRELFVDTGAWIALEVANDVNHIVARRFLQGDGRGWRWITTNWVLAEAATFLQRHASHAAAVRFMDRVEASLALERMRVTEEDEAQGWKIFREYSDKHYSVVDCTSFAVMEARSVATAFAFDRHFRQHGFRTLPQSS